ncbi:MAG: hypothetical protein H7A23_22880 [Leptospiraceae bacterium]|nr:hypothetical protein [Leptospiraceae bacterium]MCP5497410.1 hypothetical protein [Leptospiraceae bacterium]
MRKFIISFFVAVQIIFAHTIIFKDGNSIKGKIIKQTLNSVKFRGEDGQVKDYNKSQILKFVYKDLNKEEIKKIQEVETKKEKAPPSKKEKKTPKNDEDGSLGQRIDYLESRIEELQSQIEEEKEDKKARTEFYKEQNELLKKELEYLEMERKKLQEKEAKEKVYKDSVTKELNKQSARTRRLEKFLKMDETQVEYYGRKRSRWDIVKRSAVFPGWGHDYAREEKAGDFYRFTFLTTLLFGGLATLDVESKRDQYKVQRNDKLITNGLLFGSNSSLSGFMLWQPIASYNKKMEALSLEEKMGNIMLAGTVGIYIIQLTHAYFTGVEWEKTKPRNYSNLLERGFYFSFYGSASPNTTASKQSTFVMGYSFIF